jgi:hypothetical protein
MMKYRSLACAALLTLWAGIGEAQSQLTAACKTCHPAETRLHEQTRMAHAMVPAPDSVFARNLPDRPLSDSVNHLFVSYKRAENGIEVTVTKNGNETQGLIQWVMGAGAQGETPIVRSAGKAFESRVSYFSQVHRYGITVGQEGRSDDWLGRYQSSHALQACLGCHASAITRDLQPVVPGVQCQRCHLGADEHARGTGKLPLNPGKLAPAAQVRFCGNCHRSQAPPDSPPIEFARFQPFELMKSRCFQSGKLACTTCHAAHQDARRNDPDYYNSKCHVCHDGETFHADARRTGNCIGCHMPRVQIHPALQFTDHFIRVVKVEDSRR